MGDHEAIFKIFHGDYLTHDLTKINIFMKL